MKAYRNVYGNVVEINVDISLDGQPILPPDTTVDARPVALPDHYVTVVGSEWVQIQIPVLFEVFETKKQRKIADIGKYRDWLTQQPVMVGTAKFDADDQARTRLTQALVMFTSLNYLTPAWVTYDNGLVPITVIDDLKNIVGVVQNAFATRFFECSTLREAAMAATDETELAAVVIPPYNQGF